MDITKWNVAILNAEKSQETEILYHTIHDSFSILPFKNTELIESIDAFEKALKGDENILFIITSISEQPNKHLLEQLLISSYCENSISTFWEKHKFFLIPLTETNVYFNSVGKILVDLKIGKVDSLTDIFKKFELLFKNDEAGHKSIPSYKLRNAIEKSCFPSGAEEILEVLNRNKDVTHEVFNILNKHVTQPKRNSHESSTFPAIRLLIGAYAAGDISGETLKDGIEKIDAKFKGAELANVLSEWIAETGQKIKDFNPMPDYLSPLSEYLVGRKILLIEDKLDDEYWDIVLPRLFYPKNYNGPYSQIQKDEKDQPFGEIYLTHKKSARGLIDEDISKYDLILLDLYSSESNFSTHGNIYSTIPASITDFIEKIAKYYDDDDSVKKALPNIIIFSADSSGVTTHALLKDLKVTEYFFKLSDSDSHKGEYYSTFRNAIINSLKEKVLRVTGLNGIDNTRRFNRWVSQFHQKDRPYILRLMKYYRYYSAMSIVRNFDRYMKLNFDLSTMDESSGTIKYKDIEMPLDRAIFSYLGRPNKSGPATLSLFSKSDWAKKCSHFGKIFFSNKNGDDGPRYLPFRPYDDLILFLAKELNGNLNENLNIFIFDDMVLSGGQIKSYLWKLINKDLRKKYNDNGGDPNKWIELCKNHLSTSKVESTKCRIVFHAICAIGLVRPNDDNLAERYKGINYLQDDLNAESIRIAFPDDYVWENINPWNSFLEKGLYNKPVHFSGVLKIKICEDEKHNDPEESIENPCNCSHYLDVYIHFADYVPNVGILCEQEGINYEELRAILASYAYVTSPRSGEYPCDFEPFGWKEGGGLFSTYANCPANTLPLIWGNRKKNLDPPDFKKSNLEQWKALFPRFFNPMAQGKEREQTELPCYKTKKCYLHPNVEVNFINGPPPCKLNAIE